MPNTCPRPRLNKIRIVCVSDTHGHATGEGFTLPAGDLPIHAGDLTNQGSLAELHKAAHWIEQAPFEHKLIIAGNHELSLDQDCQVRHPDGWRVTPEAVEQSRRLVRRIPGVTYLEHESCTLEINGYSIRVFGSPYSLDNGSQNWAFQYDEAKANDIWSSIPGDTDILVTHTPPAGVLDSSAHWTAGGCPALLSKIRSVKPLLHVFGHHHEGRGACVVTWTEDEAATICPWTDPGAGNKKQSLFDLTRTVHEEKSERKHMAAVNASIMRTSWSESKAKEFNKPIVVDVNGSAFACS